MDKPLPYNGRVELKLTPEGRSEARFPGARHPRLAPRLGRPGVGGFPVSGVPADDVEVTSGGEAAEGDRDGSAGPEAVQLGAVALVDFLCDGGGPEDVFGPPPANGLGDETAQRTPSGKGLSQVKRRRGGKSSTTSSGPSTPLPCRPPRSGFTAFRAGPAPYPFSAKIFFNSAMLSRCPVNLAVTLPRMG